MHWAVVDGTVCVVDVAPTNIYHGSSLLAAILVDIVTTVYVGRKMAYRIHYVCALFGLPVLNIDSKKKIIFKPSFRSK